MSEIEDMRSKLNARGAGFCLAKWTQVTMHLGTGMMHSCHHPPPHQIPLNELNADVSALHNTNYKKEQRKRMLNGERPSECSHCWNIEDNTSNFSDRVYKSNSEYSKHRFDEIAALTGDENVYPSYLEASFGNVCNLRCIYCNPDFSSRWDEEIRRHGPYQVAGEEHQYPAQPQDTNAYFDAFWKWLPAALPHLSVLRLTGGEPVSNKNIFQLIDYILEYANSSLEVGINTHGSHDTKLWNKFLQQVKRLTAAGHRVIVFLSAEGTGEQSQYNRYGSKWDTVARNCTDLLSNTDVSLTFMSTYNIMSVYTFTDFLSYVASLKQQYGNERVTVDTSKLDTPEFMDYRLLPEPMLVQHLDSHIEVIVNSAGAFNLWETNKILRLRELVGTQPVGKNLMQKLHDYVTEYDRRRKTTFADVFGDLARDIGYTDE